MKNTYCALSQKQINALPERFKGFLLSPFQFNLRNGMVAVPEDTFKEMIDIITEYAVREDSHLCEEALVGYPDAPRARGNSSTTLVATPQGHKRGVPHTP